MIFVQEHIHPLPKKYQTQLIRPGSSQLETWCCNLNVECTRLERVEIASRHMAKTTLFRSPWVRSAPRHPRLFAIDIDLVYSWLPNS